MLYSSSLFIFVYFKRIFDNLRYMEGNLLDMTVYNQGIVDYARMETFAKEPRYAKLLWVNVHSRLSSG